MSAVELFDHEQFGEIRTVVENGEPWFVAKDVAGALGYAKTDDAIRKHCRRAKSLMISTPANHGGVTPPKIIPESDVYRLVFRSRLPEAESFVDWVVEEVLPSIRKTGSYRLPEEQIAALRISRQNGILFLKTALDVGAVGQTYLERYAEQALAVIEGREASGDRLIDISSFLEGMGG